MIDVDLTGSRARTRSSFGPYPIIQENEKGDMYYHLWDFAFSGRNWDNSSARYLRPLVRPLLRLPRPILEPIIRLGTSVTKALPQKVDRVVLKSIYSAFYTDWLVKNFDPTILMIQRHPLSVICSWRDLNIKEFDLLTRPSFHDMFARALGRNVHLNDLSPLARKTYCVALINMALGDALEKNPHWILLDHEVLCVDPVMKFQQLCERLDLPWSDEISNFLEQVNRPGTGLKPVRVSSQQVNVWRERLSDSEIEEVTGILAQFPRNGWIRQSYTDNGLTAE
jgi:hypothetical protein